MNPRPKISVCMATYNGERFLHRQIETILPQLSSADELIISDDSSNDGTIALIESFADQRIRLFPNQHFYSAIYNFEHALSHATGDIIFLSDQDDEWIEGWVTAALTALQQVNLVVCNADIIDADGQILPPSEATLYQGKRAPGVLRNFIRNGYIGCCCAFRQEVLKKALPFPKNLPWHDWWIGLIADTFYKTTFLNEKFIRYRRHGANASPTGGKSPFTFRKKISMRWEIATGIALRSLR